MTTVTPVPKPTSVMELGRASVPTVLFVLRWINAMMPDNVILRPVFVLIQLNQMVQAVAMAMRVQTQTHVSPVFVLADQILVAVKPTVTVIVLVNVKIRVLA